MSKCDVIFSCACVNMQGYDVNVEFEFQNIDVYFDVHGASWETYKLWKNIGLIGRLVVPFTEQWPLPDVEDSSSKLGLNYNLLSTKT